MVLGAPGRVRERARSDGTARRRRGTSSAVLGVRAQGGAAWRGRAGWVGSVRGEPGAGEMAWPGERRAA